MQNAVSFAALNEKRIPSFHSPAFLEAFHVLDRTCRSHDDMDRRSRQIGRSLSYEESRSLFLLVRLLRSLRRSVTAYHS